jgi:transposase-like protein
LDTHLLVKNRRSDIMSVMRRSFTREFKLELCQKVEIGQLSKAQACREHDLSPSLLDRWMERYRDKGASAFDGQKPVSEQARVKELEGSLGRAHLEIEFLREALGKLGVPVRRQP